MPAIPAWGIALIVSGGSMGLQFLFSPRIRQQPVDKGKMDDVRIQGSDYGAFIPRLLSGRARLAGNVVVHTGTDTYTAVTGGNTGGKKGGGGPQTTTYTYKTSLAVLVARGGIDTFDRIWDGNQLLINNSPVATGNFEAELATLAGGAASYVDGTASGGNAVQGLGAGGTATFNVSGVTTPPRPGSDPDEIVNSKTQIEIYYKCAADKAVTVDTNNGSGVVTNSFTLPNSNNAWTTYTLVVDGFTNTIVYKHAAAATANLDRLRVFRFWEAEFGQQIPFAVTGIVNPNISYPTDLNDPSGYYNHEASAVKNGTTGTYTIETAAPEMQVRFYSGTALQTADSRIKSWLDQRYGAGQGILRASAMRDLVYVMLQDYTLKNSSSPNFTFEIAKNTNTLNEALNILFADVGLVAADYDISATSAKTQYGLLEHTNQSRKQLIEYYARYHGFRLGEIDGKIRTIVDTSTAVATLDATKLRAHVTGSETPLFDAKIEIKEEHLMPREVRVSVMNPDLEYHNDTATAQLFTVSGKESKEFTFPIIDPLSAARDKAERLILKEHVESKAFEISGMPEYAKYAIGDVINIPIGGINYPCRIENKQMPLPIGPVRLQCVLTGYINAAAVFQNETTSLAVNSPAQYIEGTFPRNSVIFPIQSLPIRTVDRGRLGVYLAVCGRGRGMGEKIAIHREMDDENFVMQQDVSSPSLLGLCEDTLANHGGGTATEDTTNVLDIWFFDDVSLETVLQADIDRLPLINLIRVGNEWVQFRTATPQTLEDNSPFKSKWRISNLWRGRFSTSAAISTHAASEYACVATPSLIFYPLETADIGQVVSLKAVTAGQAVEVAPRSSFTFTPLSAYTVTNKTADRTFDANSTSIDELADVMATIIEDNNL